MNKLTTRLDPKHAILLVMDYQQGIIDRMPNADELLTKTAEAIATARKAGLNIGYVRVALSDDDYSRVPERNAAFYAAAQNHTLYAEDLTTAIHSDIAPHDGDIVVRKSRVGAFSTTNLEKQLKEKGIDTLFLAGLSTSGVVLSTIRDAADRDYRIFVLEDITADRDQEVHDLLMQKIFPRQGKVIKSTDLAELFEAGV